VHPENASGSVFFSHQIKPGIYLRLALSNGLSCQAFSRCDDRVAPIANPPRLGSYPQSSRTLVEHDDSKH